MSEPTPRAHYRRRNFFVKQGFQLRFALYPIGLFTIFLLAAGHYLNGQLRESLEMYLYMPHSHLQNPWEVVGPAVLQVAAVGAAAFLLALLLWGWRRFSRLHAEFEELALWAGPLAGGREPGALPQFRDREIAVLGQGMEKAAGAFSAWDREVDRRIEFVCEAVEGLGGCDDARRGEGLAEARARLGALSQLLASYRVEEDLG